MAVIVQLSAAKRRPALRKSAAAALGETASMNASGHANTNTPHDSATQAPPELLRERLLLVTKAADRYRRLAAAEPDRFARRWSRALELVADRLAEAHHWDRSLCAREAAVAATRPLADADDRVCPMLADRLVRLADACYAAGDLQAAAAGARDAANLYRNLGDDHALAGILQQLSRVLAVTGDAAGALAAIGEAVATRRRAETAGASGTGDQSLAWSLGLLGMRFRLNGDLASARAAVGEAIALIERDPTGAAAPVMAYLRHEYEALAPCGNAPGSSSGAAAELSTKRPATGSALPADAVHQGEGGEGGAEEQDGAGERHHLR